MLAWVGVFLVDGLKKKIIPGWLESFTGLFFFLLLLRHVFKKCYLGKGRILYLSIWPLVIWAPICLAIRKMISLFRKIVLLATNFFLRLWLLKRNILKSFSGTKKVFFMEYFSERKICAYVFSADEWIERTRVSLGRKFLGGSILSVLWVRKLFLSLFLFFFFVLLSENGDRVSCYFFICFAIQKVPFGVTNL